jgi:hypothetical protein
MHPTNLARIVTDRAANTIQKYERSWRSPLIVATVTTVVYVTASEALACLGMLYHGTMAVARSIQATAQLLRLPVPKGPTFEYIFDSHVSQLAQSVGSAFLAPWNAYAAESRIDALREQNKDLFTPPPLPPGEFRQAISTAFEFVVDHQTAIKRTGYGIAGLFVAWKLYGTIFPPPIPTEEQERINSLWETNKNLCVKEGGNFKGVPGESASCLFVGKAAEKAANIWINDNRDYSLPKELKNNELTDFSDDIYYRQSAENACETENTLRRIYEWPKHAYAGGRGLDRHEFRWCPEQTAPSALRILFGSPGARDARNDGEKWIEALAGN